MLIKFFSKNQEVLFDVMAVSNDISVRLSEGEILNDFGEVKEENKYFIITYRTKQTKIFITIY